MSRYLAAALVLAALLSGCGHDGETGSGAPGVGATDSGPQHVHGLGINPADGALVIATHTGLFRAMPGEQRARRVGDLYQDTMGFTVVGPDRFLGSGHPDARADLPPLLGLIRSADGGRTWDPVSLLGKADFHVLRAAGRRVYGFDSTKARLLVSGDAGRSWDERTPPEPLVDLAIDPRRAEHVVASGEGDLFTSSDAGRRWRPLGRDRAGLLAWADALYRVDGRGKVQRSADAGRVWAPVGAIGGQPAAFASSAASCTSPCMTALSSAQPTAGAAGAFACRPEPNRRGGGFRRVRPKARPRACIRAAHWAAQEWTCGRCNARTHRRALRELSPRHCCA